MDKNAITYERLAELVEEHQGNRAAISVVLTEDGTPMRRQSVTRLLRRHGLIERADDLSLAAGKPGPRDNASPDVVAAERERLIDALARSASIAEAAPLLRVGVATVSRWMRRHGIEGADLPALRASRCA